jgi:hypothetical protein
VQHRGLLRLRSVVFDTIWPTDAELTASCNRLWTRMRLPWRRRVPHDVPTSRCSCGIHAANEPDMAAEYLYLYGDVHQPHVRYRAIGLVSLWGSIVEGEYGWRGSNAYPRRLFLPRTDRTGRRTDVEAIRDGLADYGIPIEILGDGDTPVGRAVRRAKSERKRRRRWPTPSAPVPPPT